MLKKKGPFPGPLLHIKFLYLYTKIPLSLFKVKKEVIKGDKIIVYDFHLPVLLGYKITYKNQKTK
jgi:hypothetical protein